MPFQVKRAVQQTGFSRTKRGYKPITGVPISDLRLNNPDVAKLLDDQKVAAGPKDPTDPLFDKEWFLVG